MSDPAVPTSETPKSVPKKRRPRPTSTGRRFLTASEKATAIALWQSDEVTLEDLAKKFKRSKMCFSALFKRHGIRKGEKRAERMEAVTKTINASFVDDIELIAQRARETKDEHYKMATALAQLTWYTIKKARDDGRTVASTKDDMKALKSAAEVLSITRKERYAVLGLDAQVKEDDETMPELVVRELTPQQIKDMHAAKAAEIDADGTFDMEDMGNGEDLLEDLGDLSDESDDLFDEVS